MTDDSGNKDQQRRAKGRLDTLLLEGLASGDPIPANAEFWTELKREARAKLAERYFAAVEETCARLAEKPPG